MRLCRRAAGIDRYDPLRISGGDRQIALVHTDEEAAALLLEAILVKVFAYSLL